MTRTKQGQFEYVDKDFSYLVKASRKSLGTRGIHSRPSGRTRKFAINCRASLEEWKTIVDENWLVLTYCFVSRSLYKSICNRLSIVSDLIISLTYNSLKRFYRISQSKHAQSILTFDQSCSSIISKYLVKLSDLVYDSSVVSMIPQFHWLSRVLFPHDLVYALSISIEYLEGIRSFLWLIFLSVTYSTYVRRFYKRINLFRCYYHRDQLNEYWDRNPFAK